MGSLLPLSLQIKSQSYDQGSLEQASHCHPYWTSNMMISKRVGMTVSESVLWGLSGVLPLSPQLLKSRGDVKSVEEGGRSQTELLTRTGRLIICSHISPSYGNLLVTINKNNSLHEAGVALSGVPGMPMYDP